MDFRILQLQRIANSSISWAQILDFAYVIKIFLPRIRMQGEMLTADLVNKS